MYYIPTKRKTRHKMILNGSTVLGTQSLMKTTNSFYINFNYYYHSRTDSTGLGEVRFILFTLLE